MPQPAKVTSLSATQVRGPEVNLSWIHAGTNLRSFEIRKLQGGVWIKHAVLPKGDLDLVGTTYTFKTVARSGITMRVIALGSNGERSGGVGNLNPTVVVPGSLQFLWIIGMVSRYIRSATASVCIETPSPSIQKTASGAVFTLPFRDKEVSAMGSIHGYRGLIEGLIPESYGFTADDWQNRLEKLMSAQKNLHRVRLLSKRYDMNIVIPPDGFMLEATQHDGNRSWRVSIPFFEVG